MPVDYKMARKVGKHFQVQIAAYAMLLEETYHAEVKHGFVYLIPARKAVKIPITPKLRQQVRKALVKMQTVARQERMPAPTDWRQRCPDCEFRRLCNDV